MLRHKVPNFLFLQEFYAKGPEYQTAIIIEKSLTEFVVRTDRLPGRGGGELGIRAETQIID